MNLLERIMELPPVRTREFKTAHVRVSNIGKCGRFQVALAQGRVANPPFSEYYTKMGLTLQHILANDLRARGCWIVEDTDETPLTVSVGLTDEDGEPLVGHPDIYGRHEGSTFAIECKTCDQPALDKMTKPRKAAYEQALLGWKLWVTNGGQYMGEEVSAPTEYFVVYLSRESAGINYRVFQVTWDEKEARQLVARFMGYEEHRRAGTLPPRPFTHPAPECRWDFGVRGVTVCELEAYCWGGHG